MARILVSSTVHLPSWRVLSQARSHSFLSVPYGSFRRHTSRSDDGLILGWSCVLRLASCVLRLASCVLRLASCVLFLGLGSWVLGLGSCVLGLGSWVLLGRVWSPLASVRVAVGSGRFASRLDCLWLAFRSCSGACLALKPARSRTTCACLKKNAAPGMTPGAASIQSTCNLTGRETASTCSHGSDASACELPCFRSGESARA
jgi:hypothetical protein